jgi:inner membrane protein
MNMMNAELIWFVLGVFLVIMEFFVPGVILAFFGVAAWIVSLTTLIGVTASSTSQLLLFAVASVCLITLLRRWVRDKFIGHVTGVQNLEVNLDEFTGKFVEVIDEIHPGDRNGAVEFNGARWQAVADEHLMKGDTGRIVSRDGLTLKIEKPGR